MTLESVRVVLEGVYSPEGYFEQPQNWECERYSASIAEGKIEINIKTPENLPSQEEQQSIAADIKKRFEIQQILNRKPFEFKGVSMVRYREGGKRDIWLTIEPIEIKLQGGNADFIITNKDGVVVQDTKAERLGDQKKFHTMFLKHMADPIIQKLSASYRSATEDRKDMLVHLYEIQDALKGRFGGKANVIAALAIKEGDWDMLHDLANNAPLKEGRHRGSKITLRAATEEEIEQAMNIAQSMIRQYLAYLDKQSIAA